MKGTREHYSPAQKAAALARVAGSASISAAARELSISQQTLFSWVKAARDKGELVAVPTKRAPEVERLAAEVADLTARLARSERERNALRLSIAALTGAMA